MSTDKVREALEVAEQIMRTDAPITRDRAERAAAHVRFALDRLSAPPETPQAEVERCTCNHACPTREEHANGETCVHASDCALSLAEHATPPPPAPETARPSRQNVLGCKFCGKIAACVGAYEGTSDPGPACDDCCGHGNEDGWCHSVADVALWLAQMRHTLAAAAEQDLAARDAELAKVRGELEASEGARQIHVTNLRRMERDYDALRARLEEAEKVAQGWAADRAAAHDALGWARHFGPADPKPSHAIAKVIAERDAEKSRADELAKFKAYVHKRLDEVAVPAIFPEGPHSKEGCRVGDRLDWEFEQRFRAQARANAAEKKVTEVEAERNHYRAGIASLGARLGDLRASLVAAERREEELCGLLRRLFDHEQRFMRDGRDPRWTQADEAEMRAALASAPGGAGGGGT